MAFCAVAKSLMPQVTRASTSRAWASVACPQTTMRQIKPSSTYLQCHQQLRFASGGGLDREKITKRVIEVLESFEKCDPTKITPTASFTTDLGLDSLDAVEVVMAIEEEFSIEIPDEEADKIVTVGEAISYIVRTPEAN